MRHARVQRGYTCTRIVEKSQRRVSLPRTLDYFHTGVTNICTRATTRNIAARIVFSTLRERRKHASVLDARCGHSVASLFYGFTKEISRGCENLSGRVYN